MRSERFILRILHIYAETPSVFRRIFPHGTPFTTFWHSVVYKMDINGVSIEAQSSLN